MDRTELLKLLEQLKETLRQTRFYLNNKLNEQINRIENIKQKVILETWMGMEEERTNARR